MGGELTGCENVYTDTPPPNKRNGAGSFYPRCGKSCRSYGRERIAEVGKRRTRGFHEESDLQILEAASDGQFIHLTRIAYPELKVLASIRPGVHFVNNVL